MLRALLLISACTLIVSTTNVFADGPTLQELLDAPDAPEIVRVEEDWEILVGEPLPDSNLPQIVTVFGPTDAEFGTHTVFEFNHGTLPTFSEGGMQLQVWWRSALIGYRSQHFPTELEYNGELIQYTTVTRLHDHRLQMYIKSGTSASFGAFGGTENLHVSLLTLREDLNPYDPENSLKYSRVTFGANRVNRFVRREIRFYSEEGLYATESTDRYVHKLSIDVELDEAAVAAE